MKSTKYSENKRKTVLMSRELVSYSQKRIIAFLSEKFKPRYRCVLLMTRAMALVPYIAP
jgi:hypothetical protein